MSEFNIIEYLLQVAPAVGVLGWWIYYLQKQNKELKDEIKDIREYTRATDKERDKVLDNLSRVIEKIMDTVSVLPNGLSSVLQNELKLLLAEIKAILLSRREDEE